jgi:hypothetical protein
MVDDYGIAFEIFRDCVQVLKGSSIIVRQSFRMEALERNHLAGYIGEILGFLIPTMGAVNV